MLQGGALLAATGLVGGLEDVLLLALLLQLHLAHELHVGAARVCVCREHGSHLGGNGNAGCRCRHRRVLMCRFTASVCAAAIAVHGKDDLCPGSGWWRGDNHSRADGWRER